MFAGLGRRAGAGGIGEMLSRSTCLPPSGQGKRGRGGGVTDKVHITPILGIVLK